MRVTRIAVFVVAIGAGLVAALLIARLVNQEPTVQVVEAAVEEIEAEQVLVAAKSIPLGSSVNTEDLRWQKWPVGATNDSYIVKSEEPEALEDLTDTIARAPFLSGEPIKKSKLVRSDQGFMSAILPQGMRAAAVEVRAASTAGGFILPNDRVDVILTREAPASAQTGDTFVSETILENIRVLAIDQTLDEEEDEKVVVAQETATLELTPIQSEVVIQAQQMGSISLVLRSIKDSNPDAVAQDDRRRRSVNFLKFGVQSRMSTTQ
ncbi:MAG: Flp pilus assembly protein CpaB [Pseudomonadota bacterium]